MNSRQRGIIPAARLSRRGRSAAPKRASEGGAIIRLKDKVAIGTEAGLFQGADILTVVCGPGDTDQAHKPNEFISLDQVYEGEAFMHRLMDRFYANA